MGKTPKIIIQKATAFQLNPQKSYIVHIPGITQDEDKQLRDWFAAHSITDVIIIGTETFNISELPEVKE